MKTGIAMNRRQMLLAMAAPLFVPLAQSKSPATSNSMFTDAFLREQLPSWPEASRTLLQRALAPANGGRIDPQTVGQLATATGGSIDSLMTSLLPVVTKYAHPPISNFFVGEIARGRSGALYAGANLEFPQNGLDQSVHGEQSAVVNAFNHQETGIDTLAGTDAPCGLCRQFLNELDGGENLRILIPKRPPVVLKSLLPDSFGPKDLHQSETIFASKPHALRLSSSATDPVAAAGLQAATRSYAPYSRSPSGCAIQTKDGVIVSGSYLENAAFNPSVAPLQSALIALTMRQRAFADIARVTLVEISGRTISYEGETRSVLKAIAPQASLSLVTAQA